MSTAVIDYSKLSNAKSDAKTTSKKFDDYADELYSKIYKKLNSYSGSKTSNISNAKSNALKKYNDLKEEEDYFSELGKDLADLRSKCESVDKRAKNRIDDLSENFCDANDIEVSKLEKAISWFLNCDDSIWGKLKDELIDGIINNVTNIKNEIECWYDYEGGKELIVDLVIAGVAIIGAILIVAAIIPVGALSLLIVAKLVAAAMTTISAFVLIGASFAELKFTQNGEHVCAKNANEVRDTDDFLDLLGFDEAADVWRGVEFVAKIITFADALANGISGCGNSIKELTALKGFTAKFEYIFSGLKNCIRSSYFNFDGIKNITKSMGGLLDLGTIAFSAIVVDDLFSDEFIEVSLNLLSIGGDSSLDTTSGESDFVGLGDAFSFGKTTYEFFDGIFDDEDISLLNLDQLQLTVDIDSINIKNIEAPNIDISNIDIPNIDISNIDIPKISIDDIAGINNNVGELKIENSLEDYYIADFVPDFSIDFDSIKIDYSAFYTLAS